MTESTCEHHCAETFTGNMTTPAINPLVYTFWGNQGSSIITMSGTAVYIELTTTRQAAMRLDPIRLEPANIRSFIRGRPDPLPSPVTADDRVALRAFVRTLGGEAIWCDYFAVRGPAA
jgi:hypothetical protein